MQQEIKVKSSQTIFDICLIAYKDATKVYQLISENTNITDIGMDLTGLTLVYTPTNYISNEVIQNTKKLNKLVTIKSEQSIFDLSLQYYGSLDNIYDLIQNNSFIDSIINTEINGNILILNNDKNFVNEYYRKNSINIGTKKPFANNYLLNEDGSYLLQENGFYILLE